MPQAGVSVPRGQVHRGDRWSEELEHDPYDLSLDLHVDFDLAPPRRRPRPAVRPARPLDRAAVRPPRPLDRAAARPVRSAPPLDRATARPEPPRASPAPPERRTVTIQGRPSDRYRPPTDSRRRQPPPHYRAGFQPDRVAMWAVFLGLVLLLVAATSSHAAVLSAHGLATLAR